MLTLGEIKDVEVENGVGEGDVAITFDSGFEIVSGKGNTVFGNVFLEGLGILTWCKLLICLCSFSFLGTLEGFLAVAFVKENGSVRIATSAEATDCFWAKLPILHSLAKDSWIQECTVSVNSGDDVFDVDSCEEVIVLGVVRNDGKGNIAWNNGSFLLVLSVEHSCWDNNEVVDFFITVAIA